MDNINQPPSDKNIPPQPGKGKTIPPFKEEDLFSDPEYQQLLVEYQNTRWNECENLLDNLLKKYPDHPRLLEFKKDFDFQYSFYKNASNNEKTKKKEQRRSNTRFSLIIVGILVLVGLFVWGGYSLLHNLTISREQNYTEAQINLLSTQVQGLLSSGQPEKANELVQQMKALDPNNATVVELAAKTDELLKVNSLYNDAQQKLSLLQYADALTLLQQIESQVPGYRDVSLLINRAQTQIDVQQTLEQANASYAEGNWEDAINGFEKILTLDPNNQDAALKEQLLNSYLRRIIQMLESTQTSVDDIDKAETYYRRAIAMIPQSRIYTGERENLQKISTSLLELKYTQTAYALVIDPNQTLVSINRAVIYLNKAQSLNPKNTQTQSDLEKITIYQVAFQDYIEMNWASAIENLNKLLAIDKNYAEGKATQLLYEAHMGKGNQYYSVGLYSDAKKEYEAAETMAWDEGDNQMKIFTAQIDLGNTLGKLKDYSNASSYYKYAVESINYATRTNDFTLISGLAAAIQAYNDGDYLNSYKLFESALENKGALFNEEQVAAQEGTCLAFIAAQHKSTVQAILERNNLTRSTIVTLDQTLVVPSLR